MTLFILVPDITLLSKAQVAYSTFQIKKKEKLLAHTAG